MEPEVRPEAEAQRDGSTKEDSFPVSLEYPQKVRKHPTAQAARQMTKDQLKLGAQVRPLEEVVLSGV